MLTHLIQRIAKSALFSRDHPPQTAWQVIAWWEARRPPYNLLVGLMGIVSGGLCVLTAILCQHFLGEPLGLPNPPAIALFVVIIYGVLANVCYTGGWIVELAVRKIWPEEGLAFGKISFSLGMVFSMLLTLAPGVFIAMLGALSLLAHALKG